MGRADERHDVFVIGVASFLAGPAIERPLLIARSAPIG
jgi:hypothetical protein